MVASALPFPERRSLELPPAQHGKLETPYAFVQRMCLKASLCIGESLSAAAIFLEAYTLVSIKPAEPDPVALT